MSSLRLMYMYHYDAVKKNGENLRFVPQAYFDEAICMAGVKNDGMALRYVPEALRTESVCSEAVKENAKAVKYVPENVMTSEMRVIALKGMRFSGADILNAEDMSERILDSDPDIARALVEGACRKALKENPLSRTQEGRELVRKALPPEKLAAAWGSVMSAGNAGLLEQDGMRPPSWLESQDFYDLLARRIPSLRGVPEKYADGELCLRIIDEAERRDDPDVVRHLLDDTARLDVPLDGMVLGRIAAVCGEWDGMKAEFEAWLGVESHAAAAPA